MNSKRIPVAGGSTAGGATAVQHSKAAMITFSDCFTWIDPAFIGNVAISALVGGVVGYLVKYGLDKVFKRKK